MPTSPNLLAGDNGKSTGFVSGAAGQESGLVSNYMANPWWTNNPNQVVQYASCHDNHTLVDKLIKSTGRTQLDAIVIKMNNLAAAIYMTSQGIPFIHAGEEMLREKLDENGKRIENSYNASNYVNLIEWSNLDDETYAANSAYYAGLIEFRKAHPALSLDSAADVTSKVLNQQASGNLVTFWIDAREVTGETWYGNGGTIEDTTGDNAWVMDASAGDCTLKPPAALTPSSSIPPPIS